MEELLKNIMPIVYISVGALVSYWSSRSIEKKKRKLTVKLELVRNIHLLFGHNALYLRHNTIAKLNDIYSQIKQTEFKQTQAESTKEEMNLYRGKMQDEIDSAVKTYDTILKNEADIYKTIVEITELFSLSVSKKYRKVINEVFSYTKSAEPFAIANDLTSQNYGAVSKIVEARLTVRAEEFTTKAEEFIAKIEAI